MGDGGIEIKSDVEIKIDVESAGKGEEEGEGAKKKKNAACLVVGDLGELRARDYKVCLINSDFDLGFKVKRDLLLRCVRTHFPATVCSYEPCMYPGAKIKFMWNAGVQPAQLAGACGCGSACTGKGDGDGDGRCRKVTIAVFQSGKVVITGAHTEGQLMDAYRFLVDDVVAVHRSSFALSAPYPDAPKYSRRK